MSLHCTHTVYDQPSLLALGDNLALQPVIQYFPFLPQKLFIKIKHDSAQNANAEVSKCRVHLLYTVYGQTHTGSFHL